MGGRGGGEEGQEVKALIQADERNSYSTFCGSFSRGLTIFPSTQEKSAI